MIIKTTKKTICCGNANITAASRTSARLFPAKANTPMPQSMKTRQPPNTVFLLNFLDKIGNKAAETIPRKMLIVDKIENDLGCPMIYVK